MRQIIASRPARKLTLILFAIVLSTGGLFYVDDAGASTYLVRISDPNPVLTPVAGQETRIHYSIPQDVKEELQPGTSVSKLPSGCSNKYTRDLTYYDCSGVYFKPYYKGNQLVYMVIEQP